LWFLPQGFWYWSWYLYRGPCMSYSYFSACFLAGSKETRFLLTLLPTIRIGRSWSTWMEKGPSPHRRNNGPILPWTRLLHERWVLVCVCYQCWSASSSISSIVLSSIASHISASLVPAVPAVEVVINPPPQPTGVTPAIHASPMHTGTPLMILRS
jgi:hypothetical protein